MSTLSNDLGLLDLDDAGAFIAEREKAHKQPYHDRANEQQNMVMKSGAANHSYVPFSRAPQRHRSPDLFFVTSEAGERVLCKKG